MGKVKGESLHHNIAMDPDSPEESKVYSGQGSGKDVDSHKGKDNDAMFTPSPDEKKPKKQKNPVFE